MHYTYTMGDDFINIYADNGETFSATADNPNFIRAKMLLTTSFPSYGELRDLLDLKRVIERGLANHGHEHIQVTAEGVFYRGELLHTHLTDRIMTLLRDGFDVTPMVHFLANVMQNPEPRAVFELYGFLEKCNVPITEDGYFIAYKRVRDDYRDCYSGKFDNSPPKDGEEPRRVEVERWKVDNNPNQTCSHGLHVCSRSYLSSYGGQRVVICKVHPKDVVAIPTDYNNAKMRACGYWIVGELNPDDIDGSVDRIESKSVYQDDWNDDEPECDCGYPESECYGDCGDSDLDTQLDDEKGEKADGDEQAQLFVRDTHDDERYYPATVSDVRAGGDLYVWDKFSLQYKLV